MPHVLPRNATPLVVVGRRQHLFGATDRAAAKLVYPFVPAVIIVIVINNDSGPLRASSASDIVCIGD
jgi:hypothetical protein